MSKIPTFTHDEVIALKPCQGGFRKANSLLANWKERGYTLLEMYKLGIDYMDILWVMDMTDKVSPRVAALFSIDCIDRYVSTVEEARSYKTAIKPVLVIARDYLGGLATGEDLLSAVAAAEDMGVQSTFWSDGIGVTIFSTAWAVDDARYYDAAGDPVVVWHDDIVSDFDAAWAADVAAREAGVIWADEVNWAVAAAAMGANAASTDASKHEEQTWQMEHLNTLLINEGNL